MFLKGSFGNQKWFFTVKTTFILFMYFFSCFALKQNDKDVELL